MTNPSIGEVLSDAKLRELLSTWEAKSRHARLGHGMNLHEAEMVSALTELLAHRSGTLPSGGDVEVGHPDDGKDGWSAYRWPSGDSPPVTPAPILSPLSCLSSQPPIEPVAVLRFDRSPGNENEMPKVVSCKWLPDGEYQVYASVRTFDLQPVALTPAMIDGAWQYACELDDRTSPEDYPNHALLTREELGTAIEYGLRYASPKPNAVTGVTDEMVERLTGMLFDRLGLTRFGLRLEDVEDVARATLEALQNPEDK